MGKFQLSMGHFQEPCWVAREKKWILNSHEVSQVWGKQMPEWTGINWVNHEKMNEFGGISRDT